MTLPFQFRNHRNQTPNLTLISIEPAWLVEEDDETISKGKIKSKKEGHRCKEDGCEGHKCEGFESSEKGLNGRESVKIEFLWVWIE